jgi:hypothetical protein
MKLYGRMCVAVLGILGWIPLSASAQPAADKPVVKVGDKWEFQQSVKTSASGESNETWSRRIVEILPNDRMRVAGEKDQSILADGSWNAIDPKGAEYSLIAFKFPMTVGAAWSYTARAGPTGQLERRGNYKVAAFEPVTVPAGTFDCFHVEGEWQTSGQYFQSRGTDIYWYCPKINFVAKRRIEFDTQTRGQLQSREMRLSELTNFTPGK